MQRVPYRRVRPSRLRDNAPDTPESASPTRLESVILQCAVSGILLIFVLLLGLSNIDSAANLRNSLRGALSGAETPGELWADIRNFGGELLGTPETPQDYYLEEVFFHAPIFSDPLPPPDPLTLTVDYVSPSNPQIPGPSATPGLWD